MWKTVKKSVTKGIRRPLTMVDKSWLIHRQKMEKDRKVEGPLCPPQFCGLVDILFHKSSF